MRQAPTDRPRLRRLLVWAGLGLTLLVLVLQVANLSQRGTLPSDDFMAYWAAGRLNLAGGDPYAPDQLLVLEQRAGLSKSEPIKLWNPPWLLAVVMPFSLPSYTVGRLLWLVLNLMVTVICIDWCWRFYGGSKRYRMLALIVGFTFAPTLVVLKLGQVTPLILLGIVGFMHFEGQRRWFLAGVLTALALIKPQLLYLFWLALLLWAVKERRWVVLLGVVGACAVATAIAWLPNPAVIAQYLASLADSSVWDWMPHTVGGLLRLFLGIEKRWVQFVPAALGAAWLVAYWHRYHSHWEWPEQMPVVLLVSLVTTPYDLLHDEVVLLIPAIQALTWLQGVGRRSLTIGAILIYVAFNSLMLFPVVMRTSDSQHALFYLGWAASASLLLLAYLLLRMYFGAGQRMDPHPVAG